MTKRGEYEGWTRGVYRIGDVDVDAYHARRWGRDFYVEATVVDILDDERAEMLLRSQLAKMLADTGAVTA